MSYKEKLDKIADSLLQDNWLDDLYTIDLQYIFNQMSMKQRQVVEHLIEGYNNKEIAALLNVTERQIRYHKRNAKFRFLNVLIGIGLPDKVSTKEQYNWEKKYNWKKVSTYS